MDQLPPPGTVTTEELAAELRGAARALGLAGRPGLRLSVLLELAADELSEG